MHKLRIAHFAAFAPHQSGQYATVKDLIKAERMVGLDAQFIATTTDKNKRAIHKTGMKDGWLETVEPDWALAADVIVRHTCVSAKYENAGIPIILAMHGRPESTFILEHHGIMKIYQLLISKRDDPRYKGFITFWDEFMFHHSFKIPKEKIYYVPAMVDLEEYRPQGRKVSFGSFVGKPNIIVADMWRHDMTPYSVIYAAALFKQKYCKTAKVHVFGAPKSAQSLVNLLQKQGVLGNVCERVEILDEVYRSGDFLITPHVIATRVIRESLASGLPVVAGTNCPYTPFKADPKDIGLFAAEIDKCWQQVQGVPDELKKQCRQTAEAEFNLKQAGEAMEKIVKKIVTETKQQLLFSSRQRTNIINHLIEKNGYKNYLEIGVRNPQSNFDKIRCQHKEGIDPKGNCKYKMTSDEFFEKHANGDYDIIFVDGLHRWWQVMRDVQNSLNHLSEVGAIVMHDCSPHCLMYANENGPYCASVWKAYAILRMTRPDLSMKVIDTDFGVGVIQKGKQKLFKEVDVTKLNYGFLVENRKELLNLVSYEDFLKN